MDQNIEQKPEQTPTRLDPTNATETKTVNSNTLATVYAMKTAQKQEQTFPTRLDPASPTRLIPFPHVCNARSLGGMQTQDGQYEIRASALFRSAYPDKAAGEDMKLLADTMNVKMIVDLRDAKDAAKLPMLLRQMYVEKGQARRWKNIPVLSAKYKLHVLSKTPSKSTLFGHIVTDKFTGKHEVTRYVCDRAMNPGGLKVQYTDMIEYSSKRLRAAVLLATEPSNYPLLFHCIHGKDRTGLIIAFILAVCGVSREDVLADYALSAVGLTAMRSEMEEDMMKQKGLSQEFIECPPEVLQHALVFIDKKYGSVQQYLVKIGVSLERQQHIRDFLLVPASTAMTAKI